MRLNNLIKLTKHRIKKLFSLLKFIISTPPRSILQILLHIKSTILEYKIDTVQIASNRGLIKYYGISGDFMFKEFSENRFREEHFLELIECLDKFKESYFQSSTVLKPGRGIILDIGASFGGHSIKLAEKFPNLDILAFEANPLVFPLLQLNTFNYRNVKALMLAVSDKTAEILSLEALSYENGKTNSGWFGTTEVKGSNPCVSVELDELNLSQVFFIKIDIQGGELKALNGLIKVLNNYKPIIFIEIEEFHLRKHSSSSEQVLKFLLSLDYQILRFETPFPTDHIAIPKNLGTEWLKSKYKLSSVPSNFKSLIFTNPSYYSQIL